MNKTKRLSFRISEEDYIIFTKICKALQADEPYNQSEFFRIMLGHEFVYLREKGLIQGGCYE